MGTATARKLIPDDKVVIVHRPSDGPVKFNDAQTLTGEPERPGFSCRVADLFR